MKISLSVLLFCLFAVHVQCGLLWSKKAKSQEVPAGSSGIFVNDDFFRALNAESHTYYNEDKDSTGEALNAEPHTYYNEDKDSTGEDLNAEQRQYDNDDIESVLDALEMDSDTVSNVDSFDGTWPRQGVSEAAASNEEYLSTSHVWDPHRHAEQHLYVNGNIDSAGEALGHEPHTYYNEDTDPTRRSLDPVDDIMKFLVKLKEEFLALKVETVRTVSGSAKSSEKKRRLIWKKKQ